MFKDYYNSLTSYVEGAEREGRTHIIELVDGGRNRKCR